MAYANRLFVFLIGLSMLAAAATAGAAPPPAVLGQAIADLRTSNDELKREEASFRASRADGKVTDAELEDYAAYVAGLRVRHLEQCETVRALGGNDAVRPFDCVLTSRSAVSAGSATPGDAAQTEEEIRKSLDARLGALEADIDGSLLRQQQELRETASNRSANGGTGSSGSSGGDAGSGGAAGEGNRGGGATGPKGTAGSAGTSGSGSGGGRQQAGSSPSGADGRPVPDGAAKRERPGDGGGDDDIVARQLREAAEKERDPILREKLWAEYRKYKEARK